MKKRSLFCRSLILSLLLYPSSDAWSAPFTGQIPLRGNSMSLLEVVREIEETTDYSFFYKSSDLEGSAKKNYNLNGDIEEVLSEVFEGSGIYNPQIQISAESGTKRSNFRQKDKTKRSKKGCTQHL